MRRWQLAVQAVLHAERDLADPALVALDAPLPIDGVAESVLKLLPRTGATVSGRASVLREHVMVSGRQGFHAEWQATLARVDAVLALEGHSLAIWREARRRDGLNLDDAVAQAIKDLKELAIAKSPIGGPCALVIGTDALLHDGLGVWDAFVKQADAVVARQGLTRYHEKSPVVPGAELVTEALSITSNGALPFGVRSAPFGDDGAAVRKFALVEIGRAHV